MTDTDYLPSAVTFSERDPVLPDVLHLIETSCLTGMVTVRGGLHTFAGRGYVTELLPDRDPSTWSTGEQLLWRFVASLAGGTTVDLFELASRFRGSSHEEVGIIVCFLSRMRGRWR